MAEVFFDAREWEDMIRRIDKEIKDPRPILRAVFNTRGFKDVMQHFRNGEGPNGPWKPLAESTLKKRGNKAAMLQDTGNLRNGFLPENVADAGRHAIAFFNTAQNNDGVYYGFNHDNGVGVPQREFMWLSDDAQEDMLILILDMIVE